ncbi:MAG: hypothetical protein COB02_00320 [Candidatus Cloacimonadota bacterium]|nr:MAG: hypothetical protein COB02_00320 [Candidatus Cloacimonadota bacterium]
MEESGTTIKESSNQQKLSPAKLQKQREESLNSAMSDFLSPHKTNPNFHPTILSELEFKKLLKQTEQTIVSSQNPSNNLVKVFFSDKDFNTLNILTKKFNIDLLKKDSIDSGDFLSLIFQSILKNPKYNLDIDSKSLLQDLEALELSE